MAKTWYPGNLSGFYVNGKSYDKLTGIATKMCHYDGKIKTNLSKNLPPPPLRLVSDETVN